MVWMWVPGVVISAVFSDLTRRRVRDLLVYAIATGFVVSWSTVWMVPSYKNAIGALFGLIYYAPSQTIQVLGIELVSQAILFLLRRFVPTGYCDACGYCLKGLIEARCSECGKPFDPSLLKGEQATKTTPIFLRWTTYLTVLLLIASAFVPSAYREHAYAMQAAGGQRRAEDDYATGSITWYVTQEELGAMTDEQRRRFSDIEFQDDPRSGMHLREVWQDWQHKYFQEAYRRTIERKLREAGRDVPDLSILPPRFQFTPNSRSLQPKQ
jgi:hypothetical protein